MEAVKRERAVYVFEIPQEIIEELGPEIRSLGFRELTAGEELAATKRSKSDPLRLVVELVKQALVLVNDEAVSLANQSVDRRWDEFPAKIRSLCLTAYSEIHNPEEESQKAFLKSRVTKIAT